MTYRDYLIYICIYICTTRWTNVKPLTDKTTVFLKWVQHLHFSWDMALMWSHFPKLLQKAVEAWARLHPSFVKHTVKLEAFSEIVADSSAFSFLFEASKQLESCQPRWWFSGLHHLCPCIADTSQFCRVMDGFWSRLHKLSCCWSSEWGLSWQWWWWLQEQESCNCSWQILGRIWGHLTAQKDLAKLACWKSHREHGADFDNFQNLRPFIGVEILSFKNNFQKKFSYLPIFGSCIGVLAKIGCLSQSP